MFHQPRGCCTERNCRRLGENQMLSFHRTRGRFARASAMSARVQEMPSSPLDGPRVFWRRPQQIGSGAAERNAGFYLSGTINPHGGRNPVGQGTSLVFRGNIGGGEDQAVQGLSRTFCRNGSLHNPGSVLDSFSMGGTCLALGRKRL